MNSIKKIAIVGGGASGYFAAIRVAEIAKESSTKVEIFILEQSSQVLKKVRISGGGRCNVTHNLYDVKLFCQNYPRGHKELLSPMYSFQAQDTVDWFKQKKINLVAEDDGRMFPQTNNSATVIDCFTKTATELGVKLCLNHNVATIETINTVANPNSFAISFKDKPDLVVNTLLLCTGSSPSGYRLAASLGHSITERAPSLFSFKIKHPLFKDLSGLSFTNANIKLTLPSGKKYIGEGDLLITHWGLSGPAILKLSAWAARDLQKSNYKASLQINWYPDIDLASLYKIKECNAKTNIANAYPKQISKRFWHNLLNICKIDSQLKFADINKKQLNLILANLNIFECNINGQNRFKDEFVECGGVASKEINFQNMESKLVKNLFFAGELLDIDGITGGFNFQNAWTTAWIAGTSLGKLD